MNPPQQPGRRRCLADLPGAQPNASRTPGRPAREAPRRDLRTQLGYLPGASLGSLAESGCRRPRGPRPRDWPRGGSKAPTCDAVLMLLRGQLGLTGLDSEVWLMVRR